ncbi:hypothetical protein PENSPDRAFT_694383 [Peniophora sp. CONT]|nr:hypothetical protein PENSPDRAFT_694383 [Peniophora sp. CONT]
MAAYTLPNQGQPRPTLPHQLYNPQLNDNETYTVKFQEIVRDGQSTVVARMKVPTPTGHAFILRRLDTGAVSLTTMFRAAFPTAPETMEKDESGWVKANYDLSGANRAGRARFAGTWVPSDLAQILAPAYKLDQILLPLLAAEPAPNTEFRRSARTVQEQQSSPARQMPTPASSQGAESPSGPSAPKRRRAESPAPATTTTPVKPPSKKAGTNTGTPAGKPPSSAARTLRRSNRTASPAPTPIPHTVVASPRSPRSPRKKAEQAPTPAGSDATAVADDDHEAIVEGPEADMERDIAEQKELVAAFKQQREAAREWNAQIQEAAVEEKKRERDEVDAPPSFNFAETTDIVPVSERALVSNKRVLGVPIQMTPQRRSVAWGALAAAAAAAAVAYYPW